MTDKNIIEKYKDKILGIESFGSNKELYIDNFLEKNSMLDELYRMDCHEVILTEDGLKFIEEYYTIDDVAELILSEIKDGVDYKYSKKEDIIEWLKAKGNK